MIPSSVDFAHRDHSYSMLRMHIEQESTQPENDISSIAYLGNGQWKVSLDSFDTDQYALGMKAVIAGTDNFNGEWVIGGIDYTNHTLTIINLPHDPKFAQTSADGTCTPGGLVPEDIDNYSGVPVRNNNNEIMGWEYDTAGSFIFRIEPMEGRLQFAIQVIMTTANKSVKVDLYCSLDGVHWDDFPNWSQTTVTDNTIFFVQYTIPMWIKVKTSTLSSNGKYYIIAR